MLEELEILNGEISLEFDPLNSKYTVFLNENNDELDLQYKIKEGANIIIDGNYNLQDGSEVIITVFNDTDSVEYLFNVYISKTEEVVQDISDLISLETNVKKEVSQYVGPGIACVCFILILFLFVFLFHKKKIK